MVSHPGEYRADETAQRAAMLVVSADAAERSRLGAALAALCPVDAVPDAAAAHAAIRGRDPSSPYRVLLADLRPASASDPVDAVEPEVLDALMRAAPSAALVAIPATRSLPAALDAMRSGARDVLWPPFDDDELLARCRRICESPDGPGRGPTTHRATQPVADSQSMQETLALARRVAPMRSRVLLTGETGTGKEVVAELIHGWSGVPGPLVRVNCAALPETLLESELFGHERGAFTGADRRRIGRFEQAHRGTLYLDEIAELSPSTQVKLLRVLQQNEFQRLGGLATIRSDARIITATNRDLQVAIREGTFREDLYYRLDVVGIHLAPLRERRQDIPRLAEHFVSELGADLGVGPKTLAPEAVEALCEQPWPGNVRQLRNALERAVITSPRARIGVADLGADVVGAPAPGTDRSRSGTSSGTLSLSDAEREAVVRALDRAGYVQKDAARLLGVSRRKLNYMIQRLGVTHPSWRRNRGPCAGVEEPDAGAVLQSAPSTYTDS